MSGRTAAKLALILALLLVLVILSSSIFIWTHRSSRPPLEVSLPPQSPVQGEIYVSGAISNPGIYAWRSEDTVESIILSAGGTTGSTAPQRLQLSIPGPAETPSAQRININLADAWLLEALPDVGKARAQAIILYRTQNGFFRNIQEITKVEGMGPANFAKIKDLITVGN